MSIPEIQSEELNGEYLITVILIDEHGRSSKQEIDLIIECILEEDPELGSLDENEISDVGPYIGKINQMGQIFVLFS